MDEIAKMNKLILALEPMEPLVLYKDPSNEADHAMMEGLAMVFGNRGFRDYLEMEYNKTKDKTLLCSDLYGIMLLKARAATLKELLVKGRVAFQQYNNIKK